MQSAGHPRERAIHTPESLTAAIAALQAQRGVLGDAVVDTALAALQGQLEALTAAPAAPGPAPAPAPPAGQLKQVSVLFVDVVGSTAIGQQLSPEDIGAVMDGALDRYTRIVQQHHGRVLQYAGDGMLAAFGTQTAREDDVEYAVLAGLAILAETRRLAPLLRERHRLPDFTVRAGIHTGPVLLGAGVDAEGSIRGAAVNLAARMEQSAPPGRLRISHDTYRHVSGQFEVVEQRVEVKGLAEPVRGYLVERARPRSFRMANRGVDGLRTPMVGRSAELAALLDACQAVARDGRLRVATVVGEAGLGKSRLVDEFQRALGAGDRPGVLLLARAQPRSALHPYRMLHNLLAWPLRIADADPADEARRKLVEGLAPLFGDDAAPVHALGHLIGLDFSASPHLGELLNDDAALRERGFDAATQVLRRLAALRQAPLVLLLDDLHWADAGTLDFLRQLIDGPRDLPLLAVLPTRPALFETDARWARLGPGDLQLTLAPLDAAQRRQLADQLLQPLPDVPPALHRLLSERAEGNPFYMEELVKMLIDDGVIVRDAVGWQVHPDRLDPARVPQTLTGVLQARLDALAPAERRALQQAAIVGAVFSEPALAAIDPLAPAQLPALLRRQLLRPAPQSDDAQELAFAHHLLHQVTYDTVLRHARVEGHARVGAHWRARAAVAGPQQVDRSSCRALAEAHLHGRLADPGDFVRWFDGQFFTYLQAYAGRTLQPLAESVLALSESAFGADDAETAKALTNLARVALLHSEPARALPLLQRALAIQERTLGTDHPDTARTVAVLGGCHQGRGDMAAAEPLFRRAVAIRERVHGAEHPLTVGILESLAHVVAELGRLPEAEALCRRALALRQRLDGADDPATAGAMTALGEVLVKRGQAAEAEALIRQALAVQQRCLPADHPDLGLTGWHLAEALRGLGRHAEAEALARQTLRSWEAALGPEHEWTAWALTSLAELRLAQHDGAEAAALAGQALAIYQRLFGAEHAQVAATRDLLARAHALAGQRRGPPGCTSAHRPSPARRHRRRRPRQRAEPAEVPAGNPATRSRGRGAMTPPRLA